MDITEKLFEKQDLGYREFHAGLMPTVKKEKIIGVRTPQLRSLAREMRDKPEAADFMQTLPHTYYEENNLHAFLIEKIRDFDQALAALEAFLPHIDNWATCDAFSPKVFAKHTEALLPHIESWIASDRTYTVRYGLGTLMR